MAYVPEGILCSKSHEWILDEGGNNNGIKTDSGYRRSGIRKDM